MTRETVFKAYMSTKFYSFVHAIRIENFTANFLKFKALYLNGSCNKYHMVQLLYNFFNKLHINYLLKLITN